MQIVDKNIETYCENHSTPMPELFQELRERTIRETTAPQMQVGHLEGKFLQFMLRMSNSKRVLEIGTFTGYSSLAMALALPADGKVITCDIDPRATTIAQEFWKKAGVAEKIELLLGPALQTTAKIPNDSIDLAFIDADKTNYSNYWELCLQKVRVGGYILVDNTLWSGRVLNPQEESDRAIVAFNTKARQDTRVETILLPIRDGIFMARRIR